MITDKQKLSLNSETFTLKGILLNNLGIKGTVEMVATLQEQII